MNSKYSVRSFLILYLGGLLAVQYPDALFGQELQPVEFTSLPGWTIQMPNLARQDSPSNVTAYAFNDDFTQEAGASTIVNIISNSAGTPFNVWGVHPYNMNQIDSSFQGGDLFSNIFLNIQGGTFNIVSAGAETSWDQPHYNVTGSQLTQLSGTACANHVFGAGGQGGANPVLTGNAGIVIKDSAVVLGSIIGGWTVQHGTEHCPTVKGNTDVLILNVQGKTEADANYHSLPSGLIIGGSAWAYAGWSSALMEGNTRVTVDISPDLIIGETNFVKTIVGGCASPISGGGGHQHVLGNASVSISAPTNVIFTAPICAGGFKYPNNGVDTTQVDGDATLTLKGGTFANLLESGKADKKKSIYFNGTNVLAEGASVQGFDQMEFKASSMTLVSGAVALKRAGNIHSEDGSELRILQGGDLSAIIVPGDTPVLPEITQFDGTMKLSILSTPSQIATGKTYPVARVSDAYKTAVEKKTIVKVLDDQTGRSLVGGICFVDGNTVKVRPMKQLVWYNGDGDWTDTSFNNENDNYQDSISSVTFKDNPGNLPSVTVNNSGVKHVQGMTFENKTVTDYTLMGDTIFTPDFFALGNKNVQITAPVRLTGGGGIDIAKDIHVTFEDLGGKVENILIRGRSVDEQGNYVGITVLNSSTNALEISGRVDIGNAQTFELRSALPERRIGLITGHNGGSAFIANATDPDAHLIFTDDVNVARVDKKGPGKVSFIHDVNFHYTLNVYEGKMVVNGSIPYCTANEIDPVKVFAGATLRFEGSGCNRLPNNAWLSCKGGQIELCGVNIFPTLPNCPNFVLTDRSTLVADCSTEQGHLILTSLHLSSSDVLISGTTPGYNNEGLVCAHVTAEGECFAKYAPGAVKNMLKIFPLEQPAPEVDVAENGMLHIAVGAKEFTKVGPGTVIAEDQSFFHGITVKEGTLKVATGAGAFDKATFDDGTTIDLSNDKVVMEITGALTVDPTASVTLRLNGRTFSAEEHDPELRGYPVIRWGTKPEGTIKLQGAKDGYRFVKLENAGILRRDGSLILLE